MWSSLTCLRGMMTRNRLSMLDTAGICCSMLVRSKGWVISPWVGRISRGVGYKWGGVISGGGGIIGGGDLQRLSPCSRVYTSLQG